MNFNQYAPKRNDLQDICHGLIDKAIAEITDINEDAQSAEIIVADRKISLTAEIDIHIKTMEWEPYEGRGHTLTDIVGRDAYVHKAEIYDDRTGVAIADITRDFQNKIAQSINKS